jgi:hypothetical protein
MKHIKKFNEKKWSPNERSDFDLSEDIAKDLLPKLNSRREDGEIISMDNFPQFMKEHGAPLSMADAVMSDLVDLGFEFD